MLEYRKAMTVEDHRRVSGRMQAAFIGSSLFRHARAIMLYMPVNNEPDTDRLIAAAFQDNKIVILPSIGGEGAGIRPVLYRTGMSLKRGKYNVREPRSAMRYPIGDIDTIVVPGIAFDTRGNRIGYGKGYYDRFLGILGKNTVTIGFSFSRCVVDKIDTSEWDVPVDVVFTETDIHIHKELSV